MNEYRGHTTDTIQWLLESNRTHLRIAKDTFLFRDDVCTILYNIEQMTQELARRGVQV